MKKLLLTMTTLLSANYAFSMQRSAGVLRRFSAHAYDAAKAAVAERRKLQEIAALAAQLPGPHNREERADLLLSQAARRADPDAYLRGVLQGHGMRNPATQHREQKQ